MLAETTRVAVLECIDWPAVAAQHELRSRGKEHGAVAVLHAQRVVARTSEAARNGVLVGMRRREAQAACPQLHIAPSNPERDRLMFEPVVQSVAQLVPLVEVSTPGIIVLATRGPSRYVGGDTALAQRLHAMVERVLVGMGDAGVASFGVGVADGRLAAHVAARHAATIGGWHVANFDYDQVGAVGSLSISQILERSSNVGMVHIIQRMKPSVYYGWLERIGLGDMSGIDLPAETSSTLKPQEQFIEYVIEPATASFGQGFSLTPIQMVQLQGILASGGKLLTPHVVKGLINDEGEEYYQPKLPTPRQVISPATAQRVVEMMTNVVEKGTGSPARIPGYRIAGKTGTAQKASTTGGGYINAKITSFVGIFPSKEPRYVVLAVIDEPVGADAFGSTVAAPIVKTVIEDIIVSEGIPPSHPEEVISKIPILPEPSASPSPQDVKPSPNTSPSAAPTPSRDRSSSPSPSSTPPRDRT